MTADRFVHDSPPPPRAAQPPPPGTAAWRRAAVRAVLLEQDIVTRALLSEAEIDRLVDGMSMRLDGAETASESASSAMLQEMAEARDILVDALVFAGRIPPEPRPLVYMAREAAVMLSCLRPASADSPTASEVQQVIDSLQRAVNEPLPQGMLRLTPLARVPQAAVDELAAALGDVPGWVGPDRAHAWMVRLHRAACKVVGIETVPGEIIANAWPPGRGEVVRATSGDAIRAADEAIRAAQERCLRDGCSGILETEAGETVRRCSECDAYWNAAYVAKRAAACPKDPIGWQSNGPPTPPVQRDDRVRRNWAAREGKPVPPPCQKSPDCVAPPHIGNCVTAAQIDAWAAEPPARARYDASETADRSGSLARLHSIPRPFIPGDLWHDQHGAAYEVVCRADVGDRPRWWLLADARPDQLWMPRKEHLHRLPAADAATMALVARDIDRAATVLDVLRSPEGRAAIAECMSRPPQRMPDGTWREPTPGTTARPGDIVRHRDGRPGGKVHRVDGDTLWLRQEGGGGYEAVLAVDVEVVRPALGRDGAR